MLTQNMTNLTLTHETGNLTQQRILFWARPDPQDGTRAGNQLRDVGKVPMQHLATPEQKDRGLKTRKNEHNQCTRNNSMLLDPQKMFFDDLRKGTRVTGPKKKLCRGDLAARPSTRCFLTQSRRNEKKRKAPPKAHVDNTSPNVAEENHKSNRVKKKPRDQFS